MPQGYGEFTIMGFLISSKGNLDVVLNPMPSKEAVKLVTKISIFTDKF